MYDLARCAVCDSAESRLIADGDDIKREMEDLWAFHGRRLRPETPTPRLMDRVTFSEAPPLRLVECVTCGLVYRNPAERRHEVSATYANAPVEESVLATLHAQQLPAYRAQAGRLLQAMGRRGSVLEVGSYVGGFLAAARELRLPAEGLDINAGVNAFARRLGFQVHDGDITTFASERTFDAVAIWNTFDQLADPRAALHHAWALLRPGGTLAIRVPNGAFYRRHRASSRPLATMLLAQNNLLGFPYRFGFTPAALSRLLTDVGFEPTTTHGDVLVPIADQWTRPWARVEERITKALLRRAATRTPARAPWFELYATRCHPRLPPRAARLA